MIFAHDIPKGAKLYFGKKAKIKREIEHIASEVFENEEYEEIVSPFFSYHQLEALDESELVRFSDDKNRTLALRGDSSIDIIRLVIRRLKSEAKKWFYIQPVFRYPSIEINQIGAEWLEGELQDVLKTNIHIFERLNRNYSLHISHTAIAKIVSQISGVSLEDIKAMRIYKFNDWMIELVRGNLEDLSIYPLQIRDYLKELKDIAQEFSAIITPLFVDDLRYYDGVFYRFIKDNEVFAKGGEYRVDGIRSVGFSIYTDNLIKDLNG
jgi:histidyl-tRNA synthetase